MGVGTASGRQVKRHIKRGATRLAAEMKAGGRGRGKRRAPATRGHAATYIRGGREHGHLRSGRSLHTVGARAKGPRPTVQVDVFHVGLEIVGAVRLLIDKAVFKTSPVAGRREETAGGVSHCGEVGVWGNRGNTDPSLMLQPAHLASKKRSSTWMSSWSKMRAKLQRA